MCLPLGPRRGSSGRTSSRLTKSDVESVIYGQEYEACLYKMGGETEYSEYEGCLNNLGLILNDRQTTVRHASQHDAEYDENYSTIIMDAPCFPATFIFRVDK